MRLNFSGSDEDAIREGVRRLGEVVTEQVALYGTLTGEQRPQQDARANSAPEPEGARVVRMPSRAERSRRAGGS
jgi:2-aminoadipate transaminase